jgi:hypothetical protein
MGVSRKSWITMVRRCAVSICLRRARGGPTHSDIDDGGGPCWPECRSAHRNYFFGRRRKRHRRTWSLLARSTLWSTFPGVALQNVALAGFLCPSDGNGIHEAGSLVTYLRKIFAGLSLISVAMAGVTNMSSLSFFLLNEVGALRHVRGARRYFSRCCHECACYAHGIRHIWHSGNRCWPWIVLTA